MKITLLNSYTCIFSRKNNEKCSSKIDCGVYSCFETKRKTYFTVYQNVKTSILFCYYNKDGSLCEQISSQFELQIS